MNSKYSKLIKVSKELSKSKILTIGLNQTQKKIRNTLAGGSEKLENVLVFLIHDKEHDDVNAQLLAACRQSRSDVADEGINHYFLPKFSKVELCKIFGVKKLMCFSIDFSTLSGIDKEKQNIIQELAIFN